MGMYRLEVSRAADQDRQTIIDLLMPQAGDGRVFNGTASVLSQHSTKTEIPPTGWPFSV